MPDLSLLQGFLEDFFVGDLASAWKPLGAVALAALLGGLIGLERELADKPAGLRTHVFVAAAAALLVSLGNPLVEFLRRDVGGSVLQADPIRLVEAIVTGVSFLGAGTILRRTDNGGVEGLTTAASLLFTAVLGITVAVGHGILAGFATLGALVTLWLVGRLEVRLAARRAHPPSEGGDKEDRSSDGR